MKKITFTVGIIFTPSFAFAADTTQLSTLVANMGGVVNQLIPILSSIVVLAFFYGLLKYVMSAGNDEESKKAKSYMIRGILGMFVLATIWGIVGFLQNTIGNTQGPTQVDLTLPNFTQGTVITPQ